MSDIKRIQTILDEANAFLEEQGFFKVDVDMKIQSQKESNPFTFYVRSATAQHEIYDLDVYQGETIDEAEVRLWNALRAMQTPKEIELDKFRRTMARQIEKARDLGLDDVDAPDAPTGQVNYVSWLEDMMKSLTENVIEDQRDNIAAE